MTSRFSLLILGTICIASLGAAQAPERVTQFKELVKYQLPGPMDRTSSVAIGDVNGDAFVDIFIGNVGAQDRLLVNNGKGQFVDETAKRLPSSLDDTYAAALADIDLDGDLDLVLGMGFVPGQLPAKIWVNDGIGRFVDESYSRLPFDINTGPARTRDVSVGDIDGDSFPDLVLSLVSGAGAVLPAPAWPTKVYASIGGGNFRDHSAVLPPTIFERTCSVLADVDLDGDLDLVFGTVGGAPSELFVNDGFGFLTQSPGLPAFLDDTLAIETADLTKDGLPDLILGNREGDRIYVNIGGLFAEKPELTLLPSFGPTYAIVVGDIDQDRDLDIILAKDGANRLHLMVAGTLVESTVQRLPLDAEPTRALALGDVDLDEDLDLVAGNGGEVAHPNRLYVNLARQAHAPGNAVFGAKYRIDFYACPGFAADAQLVIPYISLGEIMPRAEMPPFGYWCLDPSTLITLPVAPINARGMFSLWLDIPAMPDIPTYLCTQGLILHSGDWRIWRLSNVIADQIVMPPTN